MRLRAASDFGAVIADRREELGLTQSELARRADVTREWVVRLEKGSSTVTLFRLMRVLRELGLSVDLSATDPAAPSDPATEAA